mmetsp:Transcript_5307/g.15577  ORF Transcript_5307/g.15577 Transcript_5307/m.15577 type:complete len:276 (+) Transcript_5307:1090-1917(+)
MAGQRDRNLGDQDRSFVADTEFQGPPKAAEDRQRLDVRAQKVGVGRELVNDLQGPNFRSVRHLGQLRQLVRVHGLDDAHQIDGAQNDMHLDGTFGELAPQLCQDFDAQVQRVLHPILGADRLDKNVVGNLFVKQLDVRLRNDDVAQTLRFIGGRVPAAHVGFRRAGMQLQRKLRVRRPMIRREHVDAARQVLGSLPKGGRFRGLLACPQVQFNCLHLLRRGTAERGARGCDLRVQQIHDCKQHLLRLLWTQVLDEQFGQPMLQTNGRIQPSSDQR